MKLTQNRSGVRQALFAFAVIFFALVLRGSYFGLEYYYQLDDYIHFRQLPADFDVVRFCIDGGYFSSRPLAIWSDFVIWSPMNHYLAMAVICAMYAASAVIYQRVFQTHFGTGSFFLVVFTLLPLGFEGTYWLAASTRIVPPFLFSALALWCLERFVQTKRYWLLPVYVLCSLLSFALYEQMLVLSLSLNLMLMLLHLMKKRWHALWGLLVFLDVGIYVAFTSYFTVADSSLGSRMDLILPWHEGYFTYFVPGLTDQIRTAFVDGSWSTIVKGFVRGLQIMVQRTADPLEAPAALAPLIVLLVPHILLTAREDAVNPKAENQKWVLVFGLLAFLAPVTPFFIIADAWFSLRNTVPSFLGLALVGDWLVRKLAKKHTAVITALFAAVCLVASVSELHDYRMTTVYNERVANAVAEAEKTYDLSGNVGILGLNESYLEDQNFRFHAHIVGSHSSDWALSGLVNFYHGARPSFSATPLDTSGDVYFNAWTEAAKDPERFDELLLYDHETGTIERLTKESREDGTLLYDKDHNLRGKIWKDEQGLGRIEFYPVSG